MQAYKGWLTLGLWLGLAGLFSIAIVDLPYTPIIFTISVTGALACSMILYRLHGGRWKPLIIGIVLMVTTILGGTLLLEWTAAR